MDVVNTPDDTWFIKLHFPVPSLARLGACNVVPASILVFFRSYISGNVRVYYWFLWHLSCSQAVYLPSQHLRLFLVCSAGKWRSHTRRQRDPEVPCHWRPEPRNKVGRMLLKQFTQELCSSALCLINLLKVWADLSSLKALVANIFF